MDDRIEAPLTMKTAMKLPPDVSTVNYESQDEKDDSDLQLLWSRIMDEGNYTNSSTYIKVEVLLLCWAESCNDMTTREEVNKLVTTFEDHFYYNTQVQYLDTTIEGRLQVRVNHIVATFVHDHDGPNTLLIVYYAGHGRPGGDYGDLELMGQITANAPQNQHKHLGSLVWNKTEKILLPAEADVLEIFDCCYAGQLGLTTRGQRSFEYLAATDAMGSTQLPGPDSFTSALVHALETLVKEKAEGRFTTVELVKRIRLHKHFPNDQTPVLSDRDTKSTAGRIMLHPLKETSSNSQSFPKEVATLDPLRRQTLTLHFDFEEKPSQTCIEQLGRRLNGIFERDTLGVNGVRWGGVRQPTVTRALKASLQRSRRLAKRKQASLDIGRSEKWLAESVTGPLTPSSSDHHSLPKSSDSSEECERKIQDHKGRNKRRKSSLNNRDSSSRTTSTGP